jgi:hypothetical protein
MCVVAKPTMKKHLETTSKLVVLASSHFIIRKAKNADL